MKEIDLDLILESYSSRKTVDPRFDVDKTKIDNPQLVNDKWQVLSNEEVSEDGKQILYLHVPFCAVRCPFCRFFKNFSHNDETIDQYAQALSQEIIQTAHDIKTPRKPATAVYFGGGTPSLLSEQSLSVILDNLKNNFPLEDNCEITLEGRVEDIEPEKIDGYVKLGINRFSLGLQSFNTSVRNRMGRPKTREVILSNLDIIKKHKAVAVSADLIYGLPNQTIEIWEQDLKDLVSSPIDAVDTYQLEDSVLRELMGKGLDKYYLADQATRARMYILTLKILPENGFVRVNNTHWVRGTQDRNLYTSLTRSGHDIYKNNVLAFGSGAQGKSGHTKYQIERDINKYYDSVARGSKPIEYIEETKSDQYIEELVCEIDSGSVDTSVIQKRYGVNLIQKFSTLIERLGSLNLITINGDVINLTNSGKFWKSNVALEFIKNRHT